MLLFGSKTDSAPFKTKYEFEYEYEYMKITQRMNYLYYNNQ